jgi:N-acetylglucosaminyl-diphospho-decaprenol L-rhamnosyltransferase
MNHKTPIFILHWNQPSRCLATIKSFCDQRVPICIAVIDNGSDLRNQAALKQQLPKTVRYLPLGTNRGWGGAFNVALGKWLLANNGDFCFISAHDALPEPECLSRLIDSFRLDTRLGIVSPQYGINHLPKFTPVRGQRLRSVDFRPAGTVEPVPWVHGTLMGFRRACLQEIGLFDDRYFAYGDELEICLRANRAGWRTAIVWSAKVKNPETSVPKSLVTYLQTRGTLLVANDYGGKSASLLRAVLIVVNTMRLVVLGKLDRNAAVAKMWAVSDFLRGRLGKPPDSLIGEE